MQIDQGPKTLQELFEGNRVIEIPSFQRNYVWKNSNAIQLLKDAHEAGDRNSEHFFGPIVVLRTDKGYELVDGQQRVTTAMLALSRLRDMLLDLRFFPATERNFVDEMSTLLDSFFVQAIPGLPFKFRAGMLIRDLFDQAVLTKPHLREAEITRNGANLSKLALSDSRELRRIYFCVKDYYESEFNGLAPSEAKVKFKDMFSGLTQKFQIHSMVVHDEVDAYQLFESINYLGIRLEPGDLLKSLTLRTVHKDSPGEAVDRAIDEWDLFAESLEGYPISKFLRHFLLTKVKHKVGEAKIFGEFRDLVGNRAEGALKVLKELREAGKLYGFLLGHGSLPGDPSVVQGMKATVDKLNIFSDTHRIFLLKILLNRKLNLNMQAKAFRAVEYLTFRLVCARANRQNTEDTYQAFGFKLDNVTNEAELEVWIDELLVGVYTDENLRNHTVSNCSKVGIEFDPRENLARYALAVVSSQLDMGWNVETTLEHLAPQKPKGEANWRTKVGNVTDPYMNVVHWWGNLTWLERPLNSGIGNSEWLRKVEGDALKSYRGLKDSGFALTKEVVTQCPNEWTHESIVTRGHWLRESLIQSRSLAWVKTGSVAPPIASSWVV
jgi:hypothetical protein